MPWYTDIFNYIDQGEYPPNTTKRAQRALRLLASQFIIRHGNLYKPMTDGPNLLCIDKPQTVRTMESIHAGECGPHMGGKTLAQKIMRQGDFWTTMERYCHQFVKTCPECQIHANFQHVTPSMLYSLTSPWPFSTWGIDIIGKITPSGVGGHEYVLVAIDYFTKWVEAQSYAKLTAKHVAKQSSWKEPSSVVVGSPMRESVTKEAIFKQNTKICWKNITSSKIQDSTPQVLSIQATNEWGGRGGK